MGWATKNTLVSELVLSELWILGQHSDHGGVKEWKHGRLKEPGATQGGESKSHLIVFVWECVLDDLGEVVDQEEDRGNQRGTSQEPLVLPSTISSASPDNGTDEVDTLKGHDKTDLRVVETPILLQQVTKGTHGRIDSHGQPEVEELGKDEPALNKGLVLNFSHLTGLGKSEEDAQGYLMGWIEL